MKRAFEHGARTTSPRRLDAPQAHSRRSCLGHETTATTPAFGRAGLPSVIEPNHAAYEVLLCVDAISRQYFGCQMADARVLIFVEDAGEWCSASRDCSQRPIAAPRWIDDAHANAVLLPAMFRPMLGLRTYHLEPHAGLHQAEAFLQ